MAPIDEPLELHTIRPYVLTIEHYWPFIVGFGKQHVRRRRSRAALQPAFRHTSTASTCHPTIRPPCRYATPSRPISLIQSYRHTSTQVSPIYIVDHSLQHRITRRHTIFHGGKGGRAAGANLKSGLTVCPPPQRSLEFSDAAIEFDLNINYIHLQYLYATVLMTAIYFVLMASAHCRYLKDSSKL